MSTDPGIVDVELPNADGFARDHVVAVDPSSSPVGLLFVWLPGTGGAPTQYLEITAAAARRGYHAVGLVYPSWPSVNGDTTGDPDPTLPERIRRERLFGEPLVDEIEVDEANSIVNRLVRLLEDQAAASPGEGWERYLTVGGEPAWSRLVFAGHSQGAGHAAFLTRLYRLGGAMLLAGPGDFVSGLGPAPWLFEPDRTGIDRMLALIHSRDPAASAFLTTQRILGLEAFGEPQRIDGLPAGSITAHMLTSLLPPATPGDFHGAPAVDAALPRAAGGEPAYLPAWTHMLRTIAGVPREAYCPLADVVADGVLDIFDIVGWFDLFASGDAGADLAAPAGVLDVFDIVRFFEVFAAGC